MVHVCIAGQRVIVADADHIPTASGTNPQYQATNQREPYDIGNQAHATTHPTGRSRDPTAAGVSEGESLRLYAKRCKCSL
jgi:hypothetical protein